MRRLAAWFLVDVFVASIVLAANAHALGLLLVLAGAIGGVLGYELWLAIDHEMQPKTRAERREQRAIEAAVRQHQLRRKPGGAA